MVTLIGPTGRLETLSAYDCAACRSRMSHTLDLWERGELLAQAFHEAYERLAPSFGYTTRRESAVPWAGVPEPNKKLMTAVCAELLVAHDCGGSHAPLPTL